MDVLEQEGEVVERGSHPELIEMRGLYAEMWERQQEAAAVDRIGSSMSLAGGA
jgi:hypothetical protein